MDITPVLGKVLPYIPHRYPSKSSPVLNLIYLNFLDPNTSLNGIVIHQANMSKALKLL